MHQTKSTWHRVGPFLLSVALYCIAVYAFSQIFAVSRYSERALQQKIAYILALPLGIYGLAWLFDRGFAQGMIFLTAAAILMGLPVLLWQEELSHLCIRNF